MSRISFELIHIPREKTISVLKATTSHTLLLFLALLIVSEYGIMIVVRDRDSGCDRVTPINEREEPWHKSNFFFFLKTLPCSPYRRLSQTTVSREQRDPHHIHPSLYHSEFIIYPSPSSNLGNRNNGCRLEGFCCNRTRSQGLLEETFNVWWHYAWEQCVSPYVTMVTPTVSWLRVLICGILLRDPSKLVPQNRCRYIFEIL